MGGIVVLYTIIPLHNALNKDASPMPSIAVHLALHLASIVIFHCSFHIEQYTMGDPSWPL
jgi:hypothetical protein